MTIVSCCMCPNTYVSEWGGAWSAEQDAMRHGWKPATEAYPADGRMLCPDCYVEPPKGLAKGEAYDNT